MKLIPYLILGASSAMLTCSCEREAAAKAPPQPKPIDESAKAVIEPEEGDPPAVVENTPPEPEPTPPMPKRKKYEPETEEQLRNRLTDLQFDVTQNEDTERPWTNKFDRHFEEGIYVCIISGEPLFSSKDKYDSGCGWPAFTKPIDAGEIEARTDYKIGYARTEVRAKTGDSHLGHVFPDGPEDKGGLRYCINSASLRFVPKDKLVEEGYGKYLKLFEKDKADS